MTRHIVRHRAKPEGFWTPERRQKAWDMYVEGSKFEDIAKHFDVTIASAQRQVYDYKKREQTK